MKGKQVMEDVIGQCFKCRKWFSEEILTEAHAKRHPNDDRGMIFLCEKCLLKLRKGGKLI